MATSSTTIEKVTHKVKQVLPTNYHLKDKKYYGHVQLGAENHYTEVYDNKEDAELELRCLAKRLSFECVPTMQEEGYYPERSIIIEEKYQQSGRTNGLYSGLNMTDGTVPEHNS